ncbi:MAG: GGDEF domain-containing protein [Mycobacteriales bacterium]
MLVGAGIGGVSAICLLAPFHLRLRRTARDAIHGATCDPLTGLLNRRYFQQQAEQLLAHHHNNTLVAVFVDLNNFKEVNDLLGHEVGDEVLVHAGQILTKHLAISGWWDDVAATNSSPSSQYQPTRSPRGGSTMLLAPWLISYEAFTTFQHPIRRGRASESISLPHNGSAAYERYFAARMRPCTRRKVNASPSCNGIRACGVSTKSLAGCRQDFATQWRQSSDVASTSDCFVALNRSHRARLTPVLVRPMSRLNNRRFHHGHDS